MLAQLRCDRIIRAAAARTTPCAAARARGDAERGRAVNQSSLDALKPGGLYGIVDQTRRHMEPDNTENGRRMDPELVIKEVQEAGFELVDYSTVLRRPDDELRYEVGRRSVTGNSDRFALLFRKPQE